MTATIVVSTPPSSLPRANGAARFRLDAVSDDALHAEVKRLTGRHNTLTAELLAHLAEVDARGIYRERTCSSLYTYCVYELRLSEDEAQRRVRAARTARAFPVLLEMLAEGAIHLTGLLLLAPHLTQDNHAELLARARFRTKREIEHLIAEFAPRPDMPARIEPLGPRPVVATNRWQAFTASLRGPVRELVPGVGAGAAPPAVDDEAAGVESAGLGDVTGVEWSALDDVRSAAPDAFGGMMGFEPECTAELRESPSCGGADAGAGARAGRGPIRYRVEFTASQRYVELLEEARDLLQHQVPNRDVGARP